jgi:hypothetical protein
MMTQKYKKVTVCVVFIIFYTKHTLYDLIGW